MKKWVVFLLGFISGILVIVFVQFILEKSKLSDNGMTFFNEPGECISTNDFKIFQVIGDNCALGYEMNGDFSDMGWIVSLTETIIKGGRIVLIINDKGEYYYDDQVIKVPKDKCMRQIGVYRYITKDANEKTVPIVKLMDK